MCGIFGLFSDNIPDNLSESIIRQLKHRGPDATGEKLVAGRLLLVHLRLAINDLSERGAQPMVDVLNGNVIVFNGEIYNFRAIRKELEVLGHHFSSDTDTEVILKGYAHWGREVLNKLIGMFAFGIWDMREQSMFLARDRMGEKPLYYVSLPDRKFAFSSELRPLLLISGVSKSLNKAGFSEYFVNGYTSTDNAIIQGISKLAPSTWMVVHNGKITETGEYWNLAHQFANKRRYSSFEEACEEGTRLLEQATVGQLVSDVPVGAFLSGGVDSGLVVAAMRRAGADARTYSAGFDEIEFDERTDALAVSRHLRTTHMSFSLGQPSFDEIIRPYRACDEPFADTSTVPTYYLAKLTRNHATVCLSGDGGDELFGGYSTYLADKIFWTTRFLPRSFMTAGGFLASLIPSQHNKVGLDYKLRSFFRGARTNALHSAHDSWRQIFSIEEARLLLNKKWAYTLGEEKESCSAGRYWDQLPNSHYLDRAMFVDMKTWLVDDILYKVDRMTMAHSLESRTPFLDHRVVEFAASLPIEYKIRGLETKRLLRYIAAKKYGLNYINKKKRGFNAPASRWISMHEKPMFKYLIGSGYFNELHLRRLFEEHVSRRADNNFKIMSLVGLAAWSEGLNR